MTVILFCVFAIVFKRDKLHVDIRDRTLPLTALL